MKRLMVLLLAVAIIGLIASEVQAGTCSYTSSSGQITKRVYCSKPINLPGWTYSACGHDWLIRMLAERLPGICPLSTVLYASSIASTRTYAAQTLSTATFDLRDLYVVELINYNPIKGVWSGHFNLYGVHDSWRLDNCTAEQLEAEWGSLIPEIKDALSTDLVGCDVVESETIRHYYPVPKPDIIADAGPDQTVELGAVVTLDGIRSNDPNDSINPPLALTYSWSFVSYTGTSAPTLSDPSAVGPTFTANEPGDYVLQLVVTNNSGHASSPDTVTISTYNTKPIADAGPDQAVTVLGTTITLDGSQSYDLDNDPLTYEWQIIFKPDGSTATLAGADTANPSFAADVRGEYMVELVVSDHYTSSEPDTVTVSYNNVAPVANAGNSQSVVLGETVVLDGTGSSDANGNTLTYRWSLVIAPAGSSAAIQEPTDPQPSFVPDFPGTYEAQLVVNDGFVDSIPSTVNIQVTTTGSHAIQSVQALETTIGALSATSFKNRNMQNAMINKLNAVIANIDAGNYADALGQLQNDVLGKTDGVATEGAPDNNDWITYPSDQKPVYDSLMEIIAEIGAILGQS